MSSDGSTVDGNANDDDATSDVILICLQLLSSVESKFDSLLV
jgi:hypothetical protein